jgi:hypothetical protein
MSETVFLSAWGLVCGTIAFLGLLRFARRFLELKNERRVPIALDGLQDRLERIESTVEATAVEVERMSEASRFMAKLLADRPGAANLASRPERVVTPH